MSDEAKVSEFGNTSSFLSYARVEGKYAPTAKELMEIMSKVDLKGRFKDSRYIGKDKDEIKIGFNSLEESHLFALSLFYRGIASEQIADGPSDLFFNETPLS